MNRQERQYRQEETPGNWLILAISLALLASLYVLKRHKLGNT